MKKLSKITEGILNDIAKRDLTGEKKKEDVIGNIKQIQSVDVGCSVLWADRDLEVDGEYLFTFDEAMDFVKNSEWRLPTLEEVADLDDNFVLDYKKGTYLFYKSKYIIEFEPRGLYYKTAKNIIDKNFYYGWTTTPMMGYPDRVHVFSFDARNFYYTPPDKIDDIDYIVIQNKMDRLCIRLVKDKEKREE